MSACRKLVLVAALALATATASVHAYDQEQIGREPTAWEMAVDGVVGRPLGLVSSALGAVTWVVTLPFSLPSRSSDMAAKKLIKEPLQYTFRRPLGQLDGCLELPESCVHPAPPQAREPGPVDRPGRM